MSTVPYYMLDALGVEDKDLYSAREIKVKSTAGRIYGNFRILTLGLVSFCDHFISNVDVITRLDNDIEPYIGMNLFRIFDWSLINKNNEIKINKIRNNEYLNNNNEKMSIFDIKYLYNSIPNYKREGFRNREEAVYRNCFK